MLKVFYGENRQGAERAIKQTLGDNYEAYEGESLTPEDLPSILLGASLFDAGERKILLKDLTENALVWERIGDYLSTPHMVIAWEQKIDKRSAGYKKLKEAEVELREFVEPKKPEMNLVFGILDAALVDGKRAVQMVEKVEQTQDPYMFFGLLVTQTLKKYDATGAGVRERKILKELAKLDMQMKETAMEPWILVKAFLLRVGKM